jgi:transposase
MLYVGMDVHQQSTTFCIMDGATGQFRTVTALTTAEAYAAVLQPLERQCRVAFEVGPQAQWVARNVRPLADRVEVANAAQIPWLFRSGRKNDRLDAQKLATLLYLGQLPTVHLPPPQVSLWRELIQYRRSLTQGQTRIKNRIHALLRSESLRCPHRSCWTRVGRAWLAALTFDLARQVMINDLLRRLEADRQSLQAIERKLETIAAEQPLVRLLRTIPGIGPRTAEAIVAFTDDPRRFPDRKHYASYFGLTPSEHSSGLVQRRGRISRRGPSVVRWVLTEAVHQAVRRNGLIRDYYLRVCRDRKDRRKKAIVATARKLLTVCHAMLRDGSVFDPARFQRVA